MGKNDKHRRAVKSLSRNIDDLKQVKERVPVTAAQKVEIGRLVRAGVPEVQPARDYKLDEETIRRKTGAQKKAQFLVSTGGGEASRFRDAAFPALELKLHAVIS